MFYCFGHLCVISFFARYSFGNHTFKYKYIFLVIFKLFFKSGEMVTNQFGKFNDALDQCSWYLFSVKMQQKFVVVVSNAQQSTTIRGYGNTLCARLSLKTVILFTVWKIFQVHFLSLFIIVKTTQTGFSYFTMLRQIDG